MRCAFSPKKVKKLAEKTGLPVVKALTRGGTDHRIDLCLEDGSIVCLWKDGSTSPGSVRWK